VEDIVILDGYNVIGAWPELRQLKDVSLEEARLSLISAAAEYQAITGNKVILVFDAYRSPGRPTPREDRQNRVQVVFSDEEQTADEWIERLVAKYQNKRRNIFVATSDQTEQTVIFGYGAYRIPVREFIAKVKEARINISQEITSRSEQKTTFHDRLSPDQRRLLEKWRREN
jgi:predicted RNA-binding protein with PIN domain